ncbi:ornithine cyclodeaminase family protein [Paraburkholderia tropica]|uniref:ornithine cyclodeaminase family protein n=1 Tax=Paraburkholderia tropica TaxID=92647 RepID=UPI002AB6419C|nr:ornithine cyclodeaminase family protein [Paraburkholderia tropica]
MNKLHFVSDASARVALEWHHAIEALRRAYAAATVSKSPTRVLARGDGRYWVRAHVAVPAGERLMGAKVFALGKSRRASYIMPLFDQASGDLVGLVDSQYLTAFRTASTSALAVDCLSPRRPLHVAVLGSGHEAHSHVTAIATMREFAEVRIFSPTPARREAFARDVAQRHGVTAVAIETAEAAVRGADLVIAAARSKDESPILYGEWLTPGATVVSIGSTLPDQREVDLSVVARCSMIVADEPEEVMHDTGDMIAAAAAGIEFACRTFSLAELVSGHVKGRVDDEQILMFKSVGSSLQDVVIGELCFERALSLGLATEMPVEMSAKEPKSS